MISPRLGAFGGSMMRFATMTTRAALGLSAMLWLADFGAPAEAAPPRCALANTIGTGNRALDYQPRSNRCEGIFQRQVATAISMQLIGFQLGRSSTASFSTAQTVRVRVAGRPPNVLLRATTTIPRTNYVMDTEQVEPDGTFSWSSAILANPLLNMSSDRLALLACTNLCRRNPSTTYFPVEPVQPGPATPAIYEVAIRAQRDLSSLTYSVKEGNRVVARGSRTGPLASSRAIRLSLGPLQPGRYTLIVLATAADGAADDLEASLNVPRDR